MFVSHGWKRAGGGFQYRLSGSYIYDLVTLRPRTGPMHATLYAKPMELDPVFWDIVGLTELNRRRPAFRIQGVFTVSSGTIAETQHQFDPDDPLIAITTAIDGLTQEFERSARQLLTLEDYESLLHPPNSENQTMMTARIVWLIATGRTTDAEGLIRDQLAAGRDGGFHFLGHGNFNEVALRYLTSERPLT